MMLSYSLVLLVALSIVNISIADTNDNEVEVEDTNPLAEAALAILREQDAQNMGPLVNNFMQSGGAAQLGDVISKFGNENAGQLLQGLGSLISSDKRKEGGDNLRNPLQGLGSLIGGLQKVDGKDEGNIAGAILQGLGSLLGSQGGQSGVDPSVIGLLIDMFAQHPAESFKPKQTKPQKESIESENEPAFNAGDLLSLAGSFLSHSQGDQGQSGNLLSYLPIIMQTIMSFTGPEAEKRAEEHSGHSWLLPPFLEKLHILFDNFIHSDLGKYFINAIGAEKTFKVFTDESGKFSYPKFVEMVENHSFRRHWIRMVTDRIADMLQYASNPKTQKTYIISAQFLINSYLKAQGFPKTTFFEPTRMSESISTLVNHVAKKYLDVKINSREFVKSAIEYIQDLIRLTKETESLERDSRELSVKLADTINLEIIEPIARVNRAYRFAKYVPACDRYVFCLVNQENPNEVESLPGLKKMLSKGSSCLAGWFLSNETKTPFWTLYTDITENMNCKALYSEKCNDFHLEEVKVTTEYVHSEL